MVEELVQALNSVHIDLPTSPCLASSQSRRTSYSKSASQGSTPVKRSLPHCRTCGQPRKGHPQSGCPNVTPPIAPSPRRTRSPSVHPDGAEPGNRQERPHITIQVQQIANIYQDHRVLNVHHHHDGTTNRRHSEGSSGPHGRYPAVVPAVREQSAEDIEDNLHHIMAQGRSGSVHLLRLSEDETLLIVPIARDQGLHVRSVVLEEDGAPIVVILGRNAREVEAHHEYVRKQGRDGATFERIVQGLGMAFGLCRNVLAAWKEWRG